MPDPLPDDTAAAVLARRREIGQHIRQARTEAGLTQEQLAERAHLDRVSVVRIETGVISARLDRLVLIAMALEVPLAHLVRDES